MNYLAARLRGIREPFYYYPLTLTLSPLKKGERGKRSPLHAYRVTALMNYPSTNCEVSMKHLATSFRDIKGYFNCPPLTFILSPRGEDNL